VSFCWGNGPMDQRIMEIFVLLCEECAGKWKVLEFCRCSWTTLYLTVLIRKSGPVAVAMGKL
jgi:hypothetical protein